MAGGERGIRAEKGALPEYSLFAGTFMVKKGGKKNRVRFKTDLISLEETFAPGQRSCGADWAGIHRLKQRPSPLHLLLPYISRGYCLI